MRRGFTEEFGNGQRLPGSGKSGRLSGQVKDFPDPLEERDCFALGAQSQPQFALEAAHSPSHFDKEQEVALEAGRAFFGGERQRDLMALATL